MTRKDYAIIAKAIRMHVARLSDLPLGMVPHPAIKAHAMEYARVLARAFEEENSNFKRSVFMDECGLPVNA